MLRVVSFNANGIRSAATKGFFTWMQANNIDVVCIQETKAQEHQLQGNTQFYPEGYYCYYHDAEKKGYSGVAIYSRQKPDEVIIGLGDATYDSEGRYIEVRFGDLSITSLYLPSGTSGEERQAFKYQMMEYFTPRLAQMVQSTRHYIICGDWNIAHKPIDLKNWKTNQKTTGFLPEERAWLDQVLGEVGMVDAFREVNTAADQYTWWSNRANAWANNVGWRIDYQIITQSLRDKVLAASIYRDERFSDHAPLIIDYDL